MVGTLGVLANLISLSIFLKRLEDTSEEASMADGVYVVLQNFVKDVTAQCTTDYSVSEFHVASTI